MKDIATKGIVTGVFIFLMTGLFVHSANAQSVWVQDYKNKATWGIEFVTPSYSFTNDPRGFDFASYLYTNIPFSEKWGLKLVFPISRYNGGGTKLGTGNPFIGFQYTNRNSGIKFDFGARIPLISNNRNPRVVPNISQPYLPHRPVSVYNASAFSEIKTSVRLNFHYRYGNNTGWVYKMGQGLQVVAPMDGGLALLVNYYGQILYKFNKFTLGGGIQGHLLTNREHYFFPERNKLNVGLLGLYNFGRFDLGMYLKKGILSGLGDETGIIFGFSFRVSL